VRLAVAGRVAEVELALDGEEVVTLDSPPWIAPLDLGPQLAPHELVARALDENGKELARARQWVNMPRPPAETEILLERDTAGRVVAARIAWQNVMGEEPARVVVSFDGRPLVMDALGRVQIPPYAPEVVHVLTVELDFESGLRSRDDVALGGGAGGEAQSELTAVPIRMTKKRKLAPAAFQGLLRAREAPLHVVTAEEGPASIWIVRDESATEAYGKLRGFTEGARSPAALPLSKQDEVSFLWPRPRAFRAASVPTALFPSAGGLGRSDGGLAFLLSHVANPSPEGLFPMYADAVAVAGLNAFESFARRAVLLVLGRVAEDASTYTPAIVKRYLGLLRVPLFVWSLEDTVPGHSPWGEVTAVGTRSGLRAAYARLRDALDAQRVLWVEGRYLPQEIALDPGAAGIELVR
jgi:hypothetical protein